MNKTIIICMILVTLLLSSCNNIEIDSNNECDKDSDCVLPMEFAIQSNCPFSTLCLKSKCEVVCPLYYNNLNPTISESYQFSCTKNLDCDCDERGNKTINCVCKEGKCYSVEN